MTINPTAARRGGDRRRGQRDDPQDPYATSGGASARWSSRPRLCSCCSRWPPPTRRSCLHQSIPGTPPIPGAITDPGKPAENMKTLKTTPDVAVAGHEGHALRDAALPANKDVTLVWMTANVRYVLDPKPDSVDYLGRKVDKIGVVLATAKTDASGAFSVALKAPQDFGGIHDIYAVVDGVQVAKGGFLVERTVTISAEAGPGRHADHDHGTSGSARRSYESVGARALRQPLRRRRDGEHDARRGDGQDPRRRRRRHALDRVRGLEPHGPVPQHGAVADSVDGRPPGHVHGHEGRRSLRQRTSSWPCPSADASTRGRPSSTRMSPTGSTAAAAVDSDERTDPLEGRRVRPRGSRRVHRSTSSGRRSSATA